MLAGTYVHTYDLALLFLEDPVENLFSLKKESKVVIGNSLYVIYLSTEGRKRRRTRKT